MVELEQLCVCWEVPFAELVGLEPYTSTIMGFLSLMEPQMKHLSFSIFKEIFLLSWLEIKLNQTTNFRACIGACLPLIWPSLFW